MHVLLMDRGVHIDPDAVRRECPFATFSYTRNVEEALPQAAGADALVAMAHEVTDPLIEAMPKLKYLCCISAGTDRIETLSALKPDVPVTSARGMHGPQMSELAFLSMIALSRDFARMQENQRRHAWERWPQRLIFGKTAVIAGIGPIAEELSLRCKAFGMHVVGVSDARSEAPNFDAMMPRARLLEAAALADFFVVLVPLSAKTRHMIDARVFAAMKPSAIIVNLARGPLIDEKALVAQLQAGKLGGAALDVFETEPLPADSPLWDMPNVIITPRIGGMSDVYASQVLPLVAHNLRAFAEGRLGDLRNVVRG